MILIDKYYAQLSSGKHHPTDDRNKYRDLQLYIIYILQIKVRDLETLIIAWDVSLKSLPQWSENPVEEEEESARATGDRGHQNYKIRLNNTAKAQMQSRD